MPGRVRYSEAFRIAAVERWRSSGESQRHVASQLGISNETLRRWILAAPPEARVRNSAGRGPGDELASLRAVNEQLQRENDRLRDESEMLARAAAAIVRNLKVP